MVAASTWTRVCVFVVWAEEKQVETQLCTDGGGGQLAFEQKCWGAQPTWEGGGGSGGVFL